MERRGEIYSIDNDRRKSRSLFGWRKERVPRNVYDEEKGFYRNGVENWTNSD